jgi:hypothetical protein
MFMGALPQVFWPAWCSMMAGQRRKGLARLRALVHMMMGVESIERAKRA